LRDVIDDPHFIARNNLTTLDVPGLGRLELATTPVKLPGQVFESAVAPRVGQDTEEILSKLLQYDTDQVAQLTQAGVVYHLDNQ
jgi:crotonobetainyl-CoA:carnitine CoA-transferase CaiB-like acyl-CoA transferase